MSGAVRLYQRAVDAAGEAGDAGLHADALRHLGRASHRAQDPAGAARALQESLAVADAAGLDGAAAEALNGLGILALQQGRLDDARDRFVVALARGGDALPLRARVEQNLGIVANIRGDLPTALTHYERSRRAFEAAGDERGCALAYHNLGMLSADLKRWDDADRYFRQSLALADGLGDTHLRGLCLMNRTEVLLAGRRHDEAIRSASAALEIFDGLGARASKSGAHRMLGIVHRETGDLARAEAELLAAIELAVQADSALHEAEASRHLALVYQALERNVDALRLLNAAHRLFRRLGARVDMVDITAKVAELEGTYLAVVRDWGQSIESADSYTHGHCERVASYAVRVAAALGLSDDELTTIRVGAYLHDVGKVRVPHEILNKPGKLTAEEFHIMQQHPVWGLELLAAIEFPWDIKPIIRSHHEKVDGTGYPDRLKGDEIPLSAQIICIADVYDALTTTRSYRPALTHAEALAEMARTRHWWREDVYGAFVKVMGGE
ncbi:MAG TPA: HD domain-containing phosphohydrolase [Gemmatimonadaceae bacterium]|nr:HD domain-containing phosphohydrolase [Gemmatimonadaceae bacterium]